MKNPTKKLIFFEFSKQVGDLADGVIKNGDPNCSSPLPGEGYLTEEEKLLALELEDLQGHSELVVDVNYAVSVELEKNGMVKLIDLVFLGLIKVSVTWESKNSLFLVFFLYL